MQSDVATMDRRPAIESGRQGPRWLFVFAWIVAAVAFGHFLYILLAWLDAPLLDQHAFRQTQTALSAYWLLQGGPFFAYETPVVGSPWSIPFEMPIYQALAAMLAAAGVPLDAAGRLVSAAFFLAAVWPLRMLWRDLRLPPLGLPIACAFLLAAPQYAFWSRTFLMESCAWFLALLWLALFVRFLTTARMAVALFTVIAGLLAVFAKATTFPAFVLLGGLILLPRAWRWFTGGLPRRDLPVLLVAVAAMLLPLAGGIEWVVFGDAIKQANPIGRLLTSGELGVWNYGTFAQRTGALLWKDTIWWHVLPDIFGMVSRVVLLIVFAGVFLGRRNAFAIIGSVIAFLTPFLVFTNLHIHHNYYQYANSAFLIAAAAVALGAFAERSRTSIGVAVAIVVIIGSQFYQFYGNQFRWLSTPASQSPGYRIALDARARTPEDGSLLVIGDDWSSVVPYYAQRKALAIPKWTPAGVVNEILADPASHLAGTRFSGVVDCRQDQVEYGPERQAIIDKFLAGRSVVATEGSCRLLNPDR